MFATEWCPLTPLELSRQLAENFQGARLPVVPVGGRTALRYGGTVPANAAALSLSELQRVIDYPARDMTITVEAGLRWETLQQQLAQQGQRLPIDVPQPHRATVGGAVATNTSGPGRYGYGTFRDYVIGISAVDGTGRLFSAGGRVVKNVAGYDFCKMLTGSLGTLGVITQLTFKLKPLAEESALLWLAFEETTALERTLDALTRSHTRPILMEVLNGKGAWQLSKEAKQSLPSGPWHLCLGFEGMPREVEWQLDQASQETRQFQPAAVNGFTGAEAQLLRSALNEYQACSDDPLTFQATVPPSRTVEFLNLASSGQVALQAHAGNGVVIGHLPDSLADVAQAAKFLGPLRQLAERDGGALVVLSCEESWKSTIDAFGARPGSWSWNHRLKGALDPLNLLNPGRFPN